MILDLNGKTITYDRTGTSETATAINVNGSEVDIVIKNGTIEVLAAKGKDGSYSWGNEKNGGTGKDAVCIQRNKGTVSLCIMKLIAKPGKGGAGYHGWGVNGNDGSPGRAYTIDPNTGTVNAMIAQGSYIVGASDNDYKSDGYPGISTTSYTTTVSLINYNVTYNANGGMPQPANATYTIESSNLSLPKVSKEGYDFVGWKYGSKTYDSDKIEKEDLPTTTERASQVNMAFEAVWKALNYKIIYNTNGGEAIPEGSYTIESETITLPTPSYAKHLFKGWYTTEDCTGDPVTTIPKGSMGEKKFYAKWVSSYDILYELNGGNNPENVPNFFTEESETITLPTPIREGYTFDGWYLKNDFSGSKETEIKMGSKGDRTYYAKWVIENYELTYHLNGGVNPPDVRTS